MKACKFRLIGSALCDLELQVSLHLSLESQIHQHLYNGRSHVKSANHNEQPTVLPTQHKKIGNSVGLENLKPICTMAISIKEWNKMHSIELHQHRKFRPHGYRKESNRLAWNWLQRIYNIGTKFCWHCNGSAFARVSLYKWINHFNYLQLSNNL